MILSATFRKAFGDLWENKARAILVVLALTVGIIGVGTVAVSYSILPDEMDKNYLTTNPASATLEVDGITDELLKAVAARPGIAAVEGRSFIIGRLQVSAGEWRELWLHVVPDFTNIKLNIITPEKGAWPPAAGEILLERTAVGVAETAIGGSVVVKIPNYPAQALKVSGTVHDPGWPPAWVESRVYGYVTPQTLALLGNAAPMTEIKFLVADRVFDKAHIIQTATGLKRWLEAEGHAVKSVSVPQPGKHVHAELMAGFLAMLGTMGILAMIMSGILVTNMVNALMGRQLRQIGIMKAIGGVTGQISRIYAQLILMVGALALAIGLPASLYLGRLLSRYEALNMMNFQIFDDSVDPWAYAIIVIMGLAIPILAGAVPVIQGSRISALAALNDHGTSQAKTVGGRLDLALAKLTAIPGAVQLSLRNLFRQRGRLALTLLTLSVAGASFITAMNVAASIDRAVAEKYRATPYDIDIAFSRVYPEPTVEAEISRAAGVERVETWAGCFATIDQADGLPGKPFRLIAPQPDTRLSPKPAIRQGRWLEAGDRNAMVMNSALLNNNGIEPRLGSTIRLSVEGVASEWVLVGISDEFLGNAAYVSLGHLIASAPYQTNTVLKLANTARTDDLARNLEIQLAASGFDVYTLWKTADTRKVLEDHMAIMIGILLVMAALFVAIGSLGLISAMGLNMLDRTRELGIMRSIGATTGNIVQIVLVEGGLIGLLSWLIALALSWPFAEAMGQVFALMLKNPVKMGFSVEGWAIWLGLILVLGVLASLFPAWRASRRPVYLALAYE